MSTLAYASLTTKREEATPGTSTKTEGPGLGTYIDAFAGLVPAEVLTLHALIISQTFTPATTPGTNGKGSILLSENVETLQWSFYGLAAISIILYVVGRLQNGSWDKWDYARVLIPPLAFTGWTMIQRSTAFDALIYHTQLSDATRTIIALFLAVLLGLAASALAYKADGKPNKT